MAETYGVFDFRALPVPTLAALCAGLRDNSRTKMKLNNERVDVNTLLLASIADQLALLRYSHTEDAAKGVNAPKSIVSALLGDQPEESSAVESFNTAEEFEAERRRIIGGGI